MRRLNVYKFETKSGSKYLFDNVSGMVIPSSPSIFYIIQNFYKLDKEEIKQHLSEKKLKIENYDAEYQYIQNLIRNGFFYKKEKNVAQDIINKDLINKSSASQLILILTESCNIRCKYCVYSENYPNIKTYTSQKMSFDLAKRAIDYYIEMHTERQKNGFKKGPIINFYGGEPFLEFELMERIITYCTKQNYNPTFYVTTNGTIMDDAIIDFIINNNIMLTVSLDGNKYHHDRKRVFADGNGTFDIVMNNIKRLQNKRKEREIKQLLTFNVCYDSYSDMYEIVEFFKQNEELFEPFSLFFGEINKYDTLYYQYCDEMHAKGNLIGNKNTFEMSMKKLQEEFLDDVILNKNISNIISNLFLGALFIKNRSKGPQSVLNNACIPGSKLAVAPDGNFYICERMNQRCPIGNVDEKINWEKINRITNRFLTILSENCENCNLSRLCEVCYLHLAKEDGKLEFDLNFCTDKRKTLNNLLITLYSTLELNPEAFDRLVESNNLEVYSLNR